MLSLFNIAIIILVLLLMPKKTIGTEYSSTRAANPSETVKFADMSMPIILKGTFEKLSECKKLLFYSTKTIQVDPDAWLGLKNLESLSIEESFIITLEANMFNHLKSLTKLKVTTTHADIPLKFPKDQSPLNPANFRGLHSLNSLWLSLPNLNEHTIKSMDLDIWQDITGTLTKLMLPGNDFAELYDNMFIQFRKLEKLGLQGNRITTVSSKTLSGLNLLREIDLSQNRINELDPNTFKFLTYLNDINMDKNKMEHLPDYLFKGLKQLRSLKLSNNRLRMISCNVFDSMDFSSTGGHPGKTKNIDHIFFITYSKSHGTKTFVGEQ